MFGTLAPQHMPGLTLGASCTPEDKTTEWWQNYDLAAAIKKETGKLPDSRHKQLGKWVRDNRSALLTIWQRGYISELPRSRINAAKRSALRKLGYAMDGSDPTSPYTR